MEKVKTMTPGDYCSRCGEVNWRACACKPIDFGADIPANEINNPCWIPVDAPSIDHTAAGAQYVIPDSPQRKVPETPLRAKRAQTTKPTVLEMYEEETKQPKLF